MKRPRINPFPGLIFAFIGLNLVIVAATVYFAASDRTFAVEPGYYQKAVAWNQEARQLLRNAELGWTAAIDIALPTSSAGHRLITITPRDRAGAPITGATIHLTAFASLAAADRTALDLHETAPGVYTASLRATSPGSWEFRTAIHTATDTFTSTTTRDIGPTPAAGRPATP